MCTRYNYDQNNIEKKSSVAAMADGGIVAGENYTWPRVVVALYQPGETGPCHVIETGLTRNPSRRLQDIMPLVDRFVCELEYAH